MTGDVRVLRRIDRYLDGVPRTVARTEAVGPFTLFVNDGVGWRFYARPTAGATTFTGADVRAVRMRQRELGQPEAVEWLVEVAPGVAAAAEGGGMDVALHPLLLLDRPEPRAPPLPATARVQLVSPEDDIAELHAIAALAFGAPGRRARTIGPGALSAEAARVEDGMVAFTRARMTRALTVTVVATIDGRPVAVGSHNPLQGVTEIVGVATLPGFRGRGLGGAVTHALVRDALERGISTVFLSAGDARIARIYERVGFRRVGSVGAARPSPGSGERQ
jgi:ribosomal protein S18 acetylase RimI-like enzyme